MHVWGTGHRLVGRQAEWGMGWEFFAVGWHQQTAKKVLRKRVECTEEKTEGEQGALSRRCTEDRSFIQGLWELRSPLF